MNQIDLTQLDLNLLVAFEVLMTEGSVTHAAARLGRTQSAVSHALARLREQLGDPLLVKQGGRMRPSPFAEQLILDVRPILRSIQRVLAPPEPFVPKSSKQTFRAALPDIAPALLPMTMAKLRRAAPDCSVEWLPVDERTRSRVNEGQIDVALVRGGGPAIEGLEVQSAGRVPVVTYLRNDHPAIAKWGLAAWSRGPAIQVTIGDLRKTGIERALESAPLDRRIAAKMPSFASVLDVLSRTDMMATLPLILPQTALDAAGLCALSPPIAIDPVEFDFIWSFRLTNDPAARWFRTQVMETFTELLNAFAHPPARKRKRTARS